MDNNKLNSRIKNMTSVVNGEEEPAKEQPASDVNMENIPQIPESNESVLISDAIRDDTDSELDVQITRKFTPPVKERTVITVKAHSSSESAAIRGKANEPVKEQVQAEQSIRPAANNRTVVVKSSSSVGARNTAANRKYSDVVEERHARAQASAGGRSITPRSGAETSRRKGSLFAKLLVAWCALLIVALAALCVWLYAYLQDYESAQPVHVISAFTEKFRSTNAITAYIRGNKTNINTLDNIDDFASAYAAHLSGKTISYVENGELSRQGSPAYTILADNEPVAEVYLRKNGSSRFNFDTYEVGYVDFVSMYPDGYDYDILVPKGSTVYVNGNELNPGYVTARGVPEVLAKSAEFIKEIPEYETYSVHLLTDSISVTGKDSIGLDLIFERSDGLFVAGAQAPAEFIASVSERCEEALNVWALYFIYQDHSLRSYIKSGTELYAYIFGSDTQDPIDPKLYNWEQIDEYEFDHIEVTNYVKYSEDCFTCDVSYKLDITFTEEGMVDDNQKLDATWVWVRDSDGWYISDIIYH